MTKTILKISGMHCQSCAKLITTKLKQEPGVISTQIDYKKQQGYIDHDPNRTNVNTLINIISDLGYLAKTV